MIDYTNESIALLPNVWNKQPTSNYYKLWSLFGNRLTELHQIIDNMNAWQNISVAQGIALDKIGEQYGEVRGNADDAFYRFKILSHIASFNKAQSINDLLKLIGQSFGVDLTDIEIAETDNPAEFAVNNLPASFAKTEEIQALIIKRIQEMCGAGIKIVDIKFVTVGSMQLTYGLANATYTNSSSNLNTKGDA